MAQGNSNGWALDGRRDTLTAKAMRTDAAERHAAELEIELSAAREELAHRENKISSLEKSLDLNVDESARLAAELTEKSAAGESARQQLEQMRLALNALQAERLKANGKWQEESLALNDRLDSATARAEKAEKMLVDAQNDLLSLSLENSALLRRVHNLKETHRENKSQVEKLQSKLASEIKAREAAVKRADQQAIAHAKLDDEITMRDAALKRAEERIRQLAELFMQLEAKAHRGSAHENSAIESGPPYGEAGRFARGGGVSGQPNTCAVLERDLDNDAWLFGGRKSARLS